MSAVFGNQGCFRHTVFINIEYFLIVKELIFIIIIRVKIIPQEIRNSLGIFSTLGYAVCLNLKNVLIICALPGYAGIRNNAERALRLKSVSWN